MTDHAELIERLQSHRMLGEIPPAEIAWVAAHGQRRQIEEGELMASKTLGVFEDLLIMLSGKLSVWMDRGGVFRRVTEWVGGDITGRLPYSRQTVSTGEVRVEEDGEIVILHESLFPEMIRECPELTTRLVHLMLDRARLFTRYDLQNEKMVSLGRLAAGLAHELDNPASAMVRGASLLIPALEEADAASQALGRCRLTADQQTAVEALRKGCLSTEVQHVRSPLDHARHEEALSDWLESKGLDSASSEVLADTPVTIEALESLVERFDEDALDTAVRWVAAGCRASSLAADLGRAAVRISELVGAVKGFTYLDAAPMPQPVDVEAGLTQTLTMLRSKARASRAGVTISVEPGLPRVRAVGGELNQVWFNLMDNALDAVQDGGSVQVHAARKGDHVVVRVVDDGEGVPQEIREKIFEPFFTTKPVGHGTGLGLDIVRRMVTQQGGDIDLASAPGHTEFRVTLPIAREDPGGTA
jgi:signal transduction histidine kinase